MCHEMSQYTPTITHAAATTTARACHASVTAVDDSRNSVRSRAASMAIVMRLEQGQLLAEARRIDRRLPQQQLQLSRRFGRMAGEVIVHVSEHGPTLHRQWPQDPRPELQFLRTVHLDPRVIDDRAIGAHPSYVNEVGGRLSSELHHLLPRNPARIGQRQRDTVLGEQRQHAVVNPAALTKLDRESHVARQRRQKVRECRQLGRCEVGTELNQNWTELVLELSRSIEELARHLTSVSQSPLMRDLLRHLQREGKSWWGSVRPPAHRLGRRHGVEGRVDFDGVEGPRIDREKIGWPRTDRIEGTHPRVVIPTLSSDANAVGRHPGGASLFSPLGHGDTIGSHSRGLSSRSRTCQSLYGTLRGRA